MTDTRIESINSIYRSERDKLTRILKCRTNVDIWVHPFPVHPS